jgi:hypothetical protein
MPGKPRLSRRFPPERRTQDHRQFFYHASTNPACQLDAVHTRHVHIQDRVEQVAAFEPFQLSMEAGIAAACPVAGLQDQYAPFVSLSSIGGRYL